MVAVGNGARASIEDQVAAAGMNVITVTAGNYRMKGEEDGGGVADHQAAFNDAGRGGDQFDLDAPATRSRSATAVYYPRRTQPMFTLIGHPEDDPMEKHNHPTSRERLGDSAAGLGAAATLTRADADAIRGEVKGVQYVAAGVHESARIVLDDKRWFTRLHGTESDMASIRRTWTFTHGPLLQRQRVGEGCAGHRPRQRRLREAFPDGRTDPTGTDRHRLEPAVHRRRRAGQHHVDELPVRRRRPVRRGVRAARRPSIGC